MLKINTYTIDQLKNYYIKKKWLRKAMKNKGKNKEGSMGDYLRPIMKIKKSKAL